MRKKMVRSLALAACVSLVTAGSAAAAVNDMDSAASVATKYASEWKISSTGTTVTNAANNLDVQSEIGIAVGAGITVYMKYKLSGDATFGALPTLSIADGVPTAGAHVLGGSGASFVTYSYTGVVASTAADIALLTLGGAGIIVKGQDSVSMSVNVYATDANASQEISSLANASTPLVAFASGVVAKVTAVTPDKIDVTMGSVVFDTAPTDTSDVGNVLLDVDVTVMALNDGLAVDMTDVVAADSTYAVSADFSALQNADETYTGDALSRLFLAGSAACTPKVTNATTLTSTKAEFKLGTTPLTAANQFLCMEVNGVNLIPEGLITGEYIVDQTANSAMADINFGTLSTLEKNGSSAAVPFALTPEGAFSNMLRVTNPSGTTGVVYVTAYNDEGESVTFDLSTVGTDLSGLVDGKLPAGASTQLTSINEYYAAAQVADSTFEVAGSSNKLRLSFNAEFGAQGATSIVVNTFSISTDGTAFLMIQ